MAEELRREQLAPAAGTWGTLVQAFGELTVSTFRACNIGSVPDQIDVRQVYAGEAEADEQYLCKNMVVPAGRAYSATEGWTLRPDDVLMVRSRNGLVAFSVNGEEST